MFFFPNPYEDEILYSVLARYCVQSGNISSIKNFDDIYGSRNIVASVELPGNLDIIISNLPVNSQYTSAYFIYNNTLFPYIASFMPEKRAKDVEVLMKNGATPSVYTKSGYISSGSIIHNRKFRFCPECVKEDMQNYGETYWHRLHQITEVFVCPKHKFSLCETKVPLRSNNRQIFIPATTEVCITDQTPSYRDDVFERLLWIAEDVQSILNRPFTFQSIESHKYVYMEEIIKKDFANLNTMVHQKELRNSILEFWGDELLKLLQSPIYEDEDCYWLCRLVRNNEISSQPVSNLLLMRFLDIDINRLLDNRLDINENKNHKGIWEDKLKELIKEKISLRQIAIELDSTTETIKKYIERLGVEPYWNSPGGRRYTTEYIKTQEFKIRKKRAREKWLHLKKKNSEFSRNKLKGLNEALYSWLIRNDAVWLISNSPDKRNHRFIDWKQRDIELLPRIKEIVENMMCGKPERITWTVLGGKLGNTSYLFKNKERLPMVNEYVKTKLETLKEFHLRKIEWAIDELEKENKTITKWNLIEKSGVKIRYIKNIYEEVSQLLKSMGFDENLLL